MQAQLHVLSLSTPHEVATPCISLSPCAICPPGCRAPCMQSRLEYWFCWCTLGVGRLAYVSLRLCAQLANYVRHAQRPQHMHILEWVRERAGELKLAASATLSLPETLSLLYLEWRLLLLGSRWTGTLRVPSASRWAWNYAMCDVRLTSSSWAHNFRKVKINEDALWADMNLRLIQLSYYKAIESAMRIIRQFS